MIFIYKGYTKTGKSVKGSIHADTLFEAKNKLSLQKIFIEKIKEKKSYFVSKIPSGDLIIISRNLSIYLKSSIPIYEAISLLKKSYVDKKKITLWLDALITSLKAGKSFYEALNEQKIFKLPPFFLYTIQVAEKSSSLTGTLKELSDFMNGIERIKKEVTKAFIYPGFIVLISIVLINFMLTNIVPNIVDMFNSTGSKLPTATVITLALSHFMQRYALVLLAGIGIIIGGFGFLFAKEGKFRLQFDKILLKLPLIKTILMNYELGRFCSVSSLLLKNGVPFAQTMNFSSKIFSNTLLAKAFESISNQIVEGRSFYDAVQEQKEIKLPADFLSAVAIGENSSELPFTLETLAEFYEENNQDKISVLLSLIEPILMIFVGGIIGFLVVSMLLPIFSISIK